MNPTSIIQTDPEILGGTPVFAGTRVPVPGGLGAPRRARMRR